jgi:3-phytase
MAAVCLTTGGRVRPFAWGLATVLIAAACGSGGSPASGTVQAPLHPAAHTDPVPNDPDDPAIWIDRRAPSRSLIAATDKKDGVGGLYVFGLDGRIRQIITPLDRPNNVDVEHGVVIGDRPIDIAVVTERNQRRLRAFRIRPDGSGLDDAAPAGLPVLVGQAGEAGQPMGIALYRRPRDGATFAIVSPKSGGARDYLWEYRLGDDGRGGLTATLVRRFGNFSGIGPAPGEPGEIEAIVVDDELGYVYYADERYGIRKWHADPDHPAAATELAVFGRDGYEGDREGLAIYELGGVRGFLVSSDQVPRATRLHVYPREGVGGHPHDHPRLAVIATPADETDGLEATAVALPGYPAGLLVMMNSGPRNFLLFDWRAVDSALRAAAR